MVTLTNIDYPHFATISRTEISDEPPFTSTSTEIWSGNVDCQIGNGGGTIPKQSVFVSDYTIYSACIESEIVDGETIPIELQVGDIISITLKEDSTPFDCTIEQTSTEEVWVEDDGTRYGTTIWANKVNA